MVQSSVHSRRPRPNKCSSCCFKLMVAVSYMTAITGGILVCLGLYLRQVKTELTPLLHTNMYSYCILLALACGVVDIVLGFGVNIFYNNRCGLSFYVFVLMLVMGFESGLGYFAFSYHSKAPAELTISLIDDVINYGRDPQLTSAIDFLQFEGKCCGAFFFNDYPKKPEEEENYYTGYRPKRVQFIPDSCCKTYKKDCALSDSPNNIYYIGCLEYLKNEVSHNLTFIFVGTAVALILHFFQIVATCCFCVKKEDEEEHFFKDHEQELDLFD